MISTNKRRRGNNVSKRCPKLLVESLESRRLLSITPGMNVATGTELTTYRLALATTGELTTLLGGTSTTSSLLDQVVEDVNQVYRRELAIEFELVSNNDSVIFTNAATDGYSNGNPFTMATENPGVLNSALGVGTYDIGHVFGIDWIRCQRTCLPADEWRFPGLRAGEV